MKVKTNELTGAALDWAVAKCEGVEFTYENFPRHELLVYQYTNDWAQGGPIIEKEKIELGHGISVGGPFRWVGSIGMGYCTGPTPLIAAMRCYVASKLGETIDVPEELTA